MERRIENPQYQNLHIHGLRHGETHRLQKEARLEEADDLTENGIQQIRESAEKLADQINPDEEVVIWSSPLGRTLHTAKIVAEVFRERGLKFHAKGKAAESGIKIFPQFIDAKHFSMRVFLQLMKGGEVQYQGNKFTIDKTKTNPRNLGYPEYFTSGAFQNIPDEVLNEFPEEYVKKLKKSEGFFATAGRMTKALERVNKVNDKPYRVIIVTHGALLGFLANSFDATKHGVDKGEYVNLERNPAGKLLITGIGEETKIGTNNVDVLEKYKTISGNTE